MESARASFKSMKSKIKDVKTDKAQSSPEAQPMRVQSGPVGHPQLSAYILTRALKRPEVRLALSLRHQAALPPSPP